jgi:hypothetical protein
LVTISPCKVSVAGIATIFILVIVTIFSCTGPNLQAQTNVSFSPIDKFSIPAYNGTISFAVNGTYSNATLANNSWIYMNLRLNGSLPIENLEFSAQNCNVTIFSYQEFNVTDFDILFLSYVVEGKGEQILNFGFGSQEGGGVSTSAEWNVVFGTRSLTNEGEGWNLFPNGTLIVTGASENENVTILHYVFPGSLNSNLPFYQQHSVAIIVAIVVTITVAIAFVIKVRAKEHSGKLAK